LLFLDLPKRRETLIKIRSLYPTKKLVSFLWESPLTREYAFLSRNHRELDAIFTYDKSLVDNIRYFNFHLPNADWDSDRVELKFNQRRCCCLISTNQSMNFRRKFGVLRDRRTAGWEYDFSTTIKSLFNSSELYSRRRSIVKAWDALPSRSLDVFGVGWDSISSHTMGVLKESKIDLLSRYRFNLALENYVGRRGYVSEKIFDALIAGVVPIYLGDQDFLQTLPKDSFVDISKFKTNRHLLDYVLNINEEEWLGMRAAGDSFLKSHLAVPFLSRGFAEDFIKGLILINGNC
jgi:hypothetical protein